MVENLIFIIFVCFLNCAFSYQKQIGYLDPLVYYM